MPKYRKAFACILDECPEKNGDDGCPAWYEDIFEKEDDPEAIKIVKDCMFPHIPTLLRIGIRSNNRLLEELVNVSPDRIALAFMSKLPALAAEMEKQKQLKEEAIKSGNNRIVDESE